MQHCHFVSMNTEKFDSLDKYNTNIKNRIDAQNVNKRMTGNITSSSSNNVFCTDHEDESQQTK